MFDLNRTFYNRAVEKAVATGATVAKEGLALVSAIENGAEVVKPSTGASSDKFVGFSLLTNVTPDVLNKYVEATIPAASPYTVTIEHSSLVSGQIVANDLTAGEQLTLGDPAANDDEFSVSGTTLTFNAARAGHSIVIGYRYYPTVLEATSTYYEGSINNKAAQLFNKVAVAVGPGEFYTMEYDVTTDWSAVADVRLGADGILTGAGSGTIISHRVVNVPGLSSPFLGIAY